MVPFSPRGPCNRPENGEAKCPEEPCTKVVPQSEERGAAAPQSPSRYREHRAQADGILHAKEEWGGFLCMSPPPIPSLLLDMT